MSKHGLLKFVTTNIFQVKTCTYIKFSKTYEGNLYIQKCPITVQV